jgi:hypothetical protein
MNPPVPDLAAMVLMNTAAVALGVLYFLRYRIERPPVGVYTLHDITAMMVLVVALPVVYLHLPTFVVATLLCLVTILVIQFTLAPMLPGRLPMVLAVGAAAVDLALFSAFHGGTFRSGATIWNDVLQLLLVIGVCNLYAQNGMKARDVAVFAAVLSGYDLVATVALPTMGEFLARVIDLPFAPVFATAHGADSVVIGLGDVIILLLWTLVSVKGYGPGAGWLAGSTALVLTTVLAAGTGTGLIDGVFPVMVLAGPVIVTEYLILRRLRGSERTMAAYRGTVPRRLDEDAAVLASMEWLADRHRINATEGRVALTSARPTITGRKP